MGAAGRDPTDGSENCPRMDRVSPISTGAVQEVGLTVSPTWGRICRTANPGATLRFG